MAERFTMDFDGVRVDAELLERKAPNVCRAFAAALPVKSFATHAKFAGEELIVMVPVLCEPENEILNVKPGDIGFYPGRQTICIFYGATRPFGRVSVFARVAGGLGRLRAVGRKVLRAGPMPARLKLT